jgi:hypothetical protein
MSALAIRSNVEWEVTDLDGNVLRSGKTENLITAVGDQMYAERGAAISSPPAAPTGMKLGTDNTAASKTGAGAQLGAYLSNSHQTFDTGYPQSGTSGSARRITYVSIFGPGKATSASPIREVALVNGSLSDVTSLAAATVARAVLTGIGSKGAGETLTVTWTHDLLGA